MSCVTFFLLRDLFASLFFNAVFVTTFCYFGSKKPPKVEAKIEEKVRKTGVRTEVRKMMRKSVKTGASR